MKFLFKKRNLLLSAFALIAAALLAAATVKKETHKKKEVKYAIFDSATSEEKWLII